MVLGVGKWGVVVVALLAFSAAPRAQDLADCRTAVAGYDDALERYRADIARLLAPPPDAAEDQAETVAPEQRVAAAEQMAGTSRAAGGLALADALTTLAAARQAASQFQRGLADLDEAEAIYDQVAPRGKGRAALHRMRAIVLSNMRRRDQAVVEIERAIALYRMGPAADPALLALNSRTKSDILRGLNRFTDAHAALGEAETFYQSQEPSGTRDLIEVLLDKSIILSRLNDMPQQLATAQRAASLAESQLGLASRTTGRALHNVAIGHRIASNFPAALTALAGAYAIQDTAGAKRQAAEALEEAARTFNAMNCFDDAVRFQGRAIAFYRARYGAAHAAIATAKHRQGNYLRSMGTNGLALARFSEAATMYDELLGPENVRSAVVLRDRADLLLAMGRTEEALAEGLVSLRALQNAAAPEEQRRTLQVLSQVLHRMGQLEAAILFAKRAVNKQQEIRVLNKSLPPDLAEAFAGRYRELYLYLSGLLIEDGRLAEAQRVIDLIKAQEVIDFVRGENAPAAAAQAPLTTHERVALGELDALLNRPMTVAKELEALLAKSKKQPLDAAGLQRIEELKQAFHENYKSFQNDVKKLLVDLGREEGTVQAEVVALHLDMLGQAKKRLKQFKGRAVMLQIASLNDAVHIFVTGPNTQSHREVKLSRRELAQLAFDAWSATAQASPAADMHLKRLYDVLVRPVADDLKASGADVIMLNLEGFLRYVPFAALRDGGRYLIEDYALAMQTPAAETVYAMGARDRARAVGFGVTQPHGDFPGLPAVARELESIFDGSDAAGVFAGVPKLDSEFDADGFATALEQGPQFVHIASHFKLEPGDESKSFLLLGNGDPLPLDLIRSDARFAFTDVDLLTLSACETAGEVGSDGREVESFATLAQGSGASSVLATLWPIADESTARLMGDFYRGLLVGDLDKATALWAAQVAMLRGGDAGLLDFTARGAADPEADAPETAPARHPYYWSAFILMGNWL